MRMVGVVQFSGMDIQQQILLSAFDLELHTKPSSSNWTQVYSDLFKKFACITPATNVPWETTFGHVVGYGAGYYRCGFNTVNIIFVADKALLRLFLTCQQFLVTSTRK